MSHPRRSSYWLLAFVGLVIALLLHGTKAASATGRDERQKRRESRHKQRNPTRFPTTQPTPAVELESDGSTTYDGTDPGIDEDHHQPVEDDPESSSANNRDVKFDIDFLYEGNVKPEFVEAFERARAKWTSVVTGDLPLETELEPGEWCGFELKETRKVDDLLIGVRIGKIDGPGGVLGRAGPCALDDYGLPRFGIMEFDVDDVDRMVAMGSFNNVILHEMVRYTAPIDDSDSTKALTTISHASQGHVLGIGTLWDLYDYVDAKSAPALFYTGEEGSLGNKAVGRSGRPFIEDDGGIGTAWGHWKEDPPLGYDSELMTGWVEQDGVPMPLSKLTVQSLRDIGYVTDESKADPYEAPEWPPVSSKEGRRLRDPSRRKRKQVMGHDRLRLPLRKVASKIKPGHEADAERDAARFRHRSRKLAETLR